MRTDGAITVKWFIAVLICNLVTAELGAQELARMVQLSVDNDYLNFWIPPRKRSDDNYTQGLHVKWNPRAFLSAGHRTACAKYKACGTELEFGQEIYTPTVDSPTPIPGQRPYAGWLYGRFSLRQGTQRTAQSVGVILGLTGPESLAEWVQNSFHKQFGFREPLGWDHQLATEPAFAFVADHSWRIAPGTTRRFVDLIPSAAVSVGTLSTKVTSGAQMRIGNALEHPWLSLGSEGRVSVQLLVGGKIEAVAHDLFLDGNTFRHSVRVNRNWHRSSWNRGLSLRVSRGTIEYNVVSEGPQYSTGPGSHTYSSLHFAWNGR